MSRRNEPSRREELSRRQAVAALLAAPLFLAGCGGDGAGGGASGGGASGNSGTGAGGGAAQAGGGASGKKKLRIGLMPKKKGLPYFTTCAKGAEEAARELGDVELIYDGPTDGSPERAAGMIEQWTLQGLDVIAVSPNDPQVLAPAMKKARDKGVQVITWDADGAPETRGWFVNQATAEGIGFALVDNLVRDLGGPEKAEGDIAIVTAYLTAANQNEWIKHIKTRLAEYPKLKLVATQPSNEDQKLAFQATQDLMKTHAGLRGIFAISSVAFPGAAEAVRQAKKADQVQVIGLSTPNDMRSYVTDGTVKSVVLWNTVDLGYLTVQVGTAAARGELKAGAEKFDAGRLGERKIAGDHVLLGDILVFNRDNIADFDF